MTSRSNRAGRRRESPRRSIADRGSARWRWVLAATGAILFACAAWGHGANGKPDGRVSTRPYVPVKLFSQYPPRRGGRMVRASNGYHHLEAVFLRPRLLKIYPYDQFGEPIQAAFFRGTVGFQGESGRRPTPLRIADDGALEAALPAKPFPLRVEAEIAFGGPIGGPPHFRDVFTFEFDRAAAEPGETSASP